MPQNLQAMESFNKLVVAFLIALFICVTMGYEERCSYSGIYNFGDSNSDTGGYSAAIVPITSPYGTTFFKNPAGRLSDGRLVLDFLAEYIGLPYVSAYLDTINTNYRHGANFASARSTIRISNQYISLNGTSPFYLHIQTTQYTQLKNRTIDLWSSHHPEADKSKLQNPVDFSKALFTMDMGQNDLYLGFQTLGEKKLRAAIPDIIDEFAISVQQLYQQGARWFWIHNTGPVGCLPSSTINVQNPKPGYLDRYGCIKYQNNIAMDFNKQLKARVIKLRSELTEAAITYVDIYTAKYKLISNTKEYGFNDPLKVCCEYHVDDVHIFCGNSVTVNGTTVLSDACANPATYVSWDGIHMTEAANRWVANQVLNGSLSDPPIPVTHACYKQF